MKEKKTMTNPKRIYLLITIIIIATLFYIQFKRSREVFNVIVSQECSAPCWRGITPGITSFDEAWKIVQKMELKNGNSRTVIPIDIDKDSIHNRIVIDFRHVGVSLLPNPEGIIKEINFTVFPRTLWDKPKLSELIDVFGNPVNLDICHEKMEIRRVVVRIRYPYMYYMFDQKLPLNGDSFTVPVYKNTRVENIEYTSPDIDIPIHDFSFPWTGYGDISITPTERNPSSTCPYP